MRIKNKSTKREWIFLTTTLMLLVSVGNVYCQRSKQYYQNITKAQVACANNNFKDANKYYAKAFTYRTPFSQDLRIAMKIALDYGVRDKKILMQYMTYVGGKGSDFDQKKFLAYMSSEHPSFNNLPYLDKLMKIRNNTPPLHQKNYPYKKDFEKLLVKDQAIRDSAYKVIGFGNDIYNSHLSKRIRQVDQQNLKELLSLMSDSKLNENNCLECFNQIETIIGHNAAHGNTDWIAPLQHILNEDRMDMRRFVRIVDRATQKEVTSLLKQQYLFFGSFNGIRLYTLMLFSTYIGEEEIELQKNRLKFGYMTLQEEVEIKSWQFLHNDELNFYGFDAFMYSDGFEDEETKLALLKEQEEILQNAIETQKQHGLRELIVVRK